MEIAHPRHARTIRCVAYDRKPQNYGAQTAAPETPPVDSPKPESSEPDPAQVAAVLQYADQHPEVGDLTKYDRAAFAGAGRRFFAFLLDCLIVMPTMLIASWVLGTFPGQNAPDAESVGLFGMSARNAKLLTKALQLLLYDSYFTSSVYRWGGTWGQKFSGIGVLRQDLAQPSKGQARARYWAAVLSMLPVGLGYLPIVTGKYRRAWHDSLAGTFVVRLSHMPGPVVAARTKRTRDKSESASDARNMEWFSLIATLLAFAPGLAVLGIFVLIKRKIAGPKKA